MWAMLQGAGAVLAKFGAKNPVIKWAVIALVGLLAIELIAREGLALMGDFQKFQQTVNDTKIKQVETDVRLRPGKTTDELAADICADNDEAEMADFKRNRHRDACPPKP